MPQVYPTGTTIYKPEKAYNGFTLIAGGTPRMIDMNGNLVNEWSASGVNGFPAKPLPGGSILTTGPRWKGLINDGITLVQLDWNGKTEWEFRNFLEVPNDGSAPADQKTMMISTQHHGEEILPSIMCPAWICPRAATCSLSVMNGTSIPPLTTIC